MSDGLHEPAGQPRPGCRWDGPDRRLGAALAGEM